MPDTNPKSTVTTVIAWTLAGGLAGALLYWYFAPQKPVAFEDQPPIIISDGSVRLISYGTWTGQGNPAHPTFYVSDGNNTTKAIKLGAIVTGSIDTNCPGSFDADKVTLTGGNDTDADTYLMDIEGSSGRVRVDPGKSTGSVSPDGHVLDLTMGTSWWLKSIAWGMLGCKFDKTKIPNILIYPHQ
jgi:hypothetical protein